LIHIFRAKEIPLFLEVLSGFGVEHVPQVHAEIPERFSLIFFAAHVLE